MKRIAIAIVQSYQRLMRSLIALRFPLVSWSGCRHIPTCSEYCVEQIEQHGVARGVGRGLVRIARCNALIPASW